MIFNCYGTDRRLINPLKHRSLIVEVAKDNGADRRHRRFDLDYTIPIEVSEYPKILLQGKKLKRARLLFSTQEWDNIYHFIAQNRKAIKDHWLGESDSLKLLNEVRNVNAER